MNTRIDIISGGYAECGTWWRLNDPRQDDHHRLYYITSGRGVFYRDNREIVLRAGRVYFIPGRALIRYACPSRMTVWWVHFKPESVRLDRRLAWIGREVFWPADSFSFWKNVWPYFQKLEERTVALKRILRVQALVMEVAGRVLEESGDGGGAEERPEEARFDGVIQYMEGEYRSHPTLEELAGKAGLNPGYFQKAFRTVFGVSPFDYMLGLRMNRARRLLSDASLSVKEIAVESGYDNPYYFSRAFRKHFQMSPRQYRESGRHLSP